MDSQQQHQLLPAKHVGSFLLLMFIATFRPTAIWPNFPISLEPIAVLAIGLLLFYKIYATIGFKAFWQKYKVELLLLTAYFSVCFLSLYLNRHRYADMHEIIRYGVTFIVITMSFPAAIFLFLLPQNKSGLSLSRFNVSGYLPWLYFLLLAIIGIWQFIDYNASNLITKYFISAEAQFTYNNINSLLSISTDFGPIMAISAISLSCVLLKKNIHLSSFENKFLLFIIIIIIVAGVFTGSRNFLLILFIISILFIYPYLKTNIIKGSSLLFLCLLFFHFIILKSSYATAKLGSVLPYFYKLLANENLTDTVFTFNDFIPNFSSIGRIDLWMNALELWTNNIMIGVSNGAFRLVSVNGIINNAHNFPLQVLVDSGIIGGGVLIFLLFFIRHKIMFLHQTLLIGIVVNVFFENPIDHSLPWIVSVAWLITTNYLINKKRYDL